MSADPYPNCFPSLGETCGNCHRCTPHEGRPMTDHPAPNPNQPDARLYQHDEWFVDLYWRTTGDDWAIPDHVMFDFGRAVLAAVLPEVERHAKADALREAAEDVDWTWETFLASDGNTSLRMHGKSPSALLKARADQIEKGDDRG